MSEVKVNKVSPRSGTTLTIGDSGDTTNVVGTLQNNGAALVGDISSVVAGTNLSGGGTSGDVTINLADASTSAKGAASFSSDNFAASSGAVTIKDAGIATAEIQDDAITLAKMAPGTDGNIISYDASGNPVAVATGSAGQVLTSAGAGAPPTFAAGGATLTGSTNNTVVTVTGANAIAGEATLTYDGTTLANIPSGTESNLRLQNSTTGSGGTDGLLIQATGNDVYINNYENADMYFRTNNTDRLKLHDNGVLSAANGVALGVGTANTASNVLDDYEEGTWTPLYVDNGNTQPTSYTNDSAGTYTKIGNTVTVWFDANFSSINNSNMSIYAGIGGYPFTASNSAGMTGSLAFYQTEFGTEEFCTSIEPNKTNGIFYHNGSTVSPGTIGTALRAFFQFTYKVA